MITCNRADWFRSFWPCLLLAGLGHALLAAPNDPEATAVRLLPNADGLSVQVGGNEPVKLTDAPAGTRINTVNLHQRGNSLVVGDAAQPINLVVAGFPGVSFRIAPGDRLECAVDRNNALIDCRAPTNNAAQIKVNCFDGGTAEMGPGASARYDQFKDQSYYLSGRGAIVSVDADGLRRDLSQFLPPMSGGPLVKQAKADKGTFMKRLTPLVEVSIGQISGEKTPIQVGTRKIMLKAGTAQTVALTNGTRVTFSHQPKSQTIDWRVDKGFCRVWVAGFQCWSAFGLTDQAAAQAWDPTAETVNLQNRTATNNPPPVREVLVRIANRFSASVPAAVAFRYANVHNCTTFAGSSDGRVEIFNPDNKQIVAVTGGLATFRGGVPSKDLTVLANSMTMTWEDGKDLEVGGSGGTFKVPPKSQQVLKGENSSQVEVGYGERGQIDIQAINTDYTLTLSPLKDWQIGIKEGDGLSIQFDWNSGVFIGTANPGNAGNISFSSNEGYSPSVQPGGMITIIGGTFSPLPRMQGSMVFYEGGGGIGGFGASFGNELLVPPFSPGLGIHEPVDPSRIPQPGASTVGK